MEVWRLVEGSIALAELTRAVARVLEGGDTGEQDRRQVASAVLALVRSLQQDAPSPPAVEGGARVGGQQELALHLQHLETLQHLVWERLNTGHWAKVWPGWRRLYSLLVAARIRALAALVLARGEVGEGEEGVLLREVVRLCDMGLLMGVPVLEGVLETLAHRLTEVLGEVLEEDVVPAKVAKVEENVKPPTFSLSLPQPLTPIPRMACPSIPTFLTSCLLPAAPHLLTGCLDSWPCMAGPTRWSTQRLVRLAGPRTVPVELGAKYTDHSWTQRLMTIEEFVTKHMRGEAAVVGYLAQHQLLEQVPSLMEDVEVPDFCYTGDQEEPDINVWIGPRGTVSPPHTDPKHNLLCQVVGSKYVALFLPSESAHLYPSPLTMMENTSRVDLDNPDLDAFPDLSKLQGMSTILGPGDTLYIPPGVWHYVRSLEESFSVSYWWL